MAINKNAQVGRSLLSLAPILAWLPPEYLLHTCPIKLLHRVLSNTMSLPLHYVFQPFELLLNRLPSKQLAGLPFLGAAMVPPNSVHAVARAAVEAATNSNVPPGVMDPWQIQQYNMP